MSNDATLMSNCENKTSQNFTFQTLYDHMTVISGVVGLNPADENMASPSVYLV